MAKRKACFSLDTTVLVFTVFTTRGVYFLVAIIRAFETKSMQRIVTHSRERNVALGATIHGKMVNRKAIQNTIGRSESRDVNHFLRFSTWNLKSNNLVLSRNDCVDDLSNFVKTKVGCFVSICFITSNKTTHFRFKLIDMWYMLSGVKRN